MYYKEAYCLKDVFMIPDGKEMPEVHFRQIQTVFWRKDLGEKLGTVYSTDIAYLVLEDREAW